MKRIFTFIFLFVAVVLFTSCHDTYSICDLNKTVTVKANLYTKVGGVESLASAPLFTLSVLNSPNKLYDQTPNVSTFGFILNPTTDSAKYIIKTSATLPLDTLTLFYTTQTVTLSQECGSINTHQITNVKTTLNTLDSVKIINPTVNNIFIDNLKIYL